MGHYASEMHLDVDERPRRPDNEETFLQNLEATAGNFDKKYGKGIGQRFKEEELENLRKLKERIKKGRTIDGKFNWAEAQYYAHIKMGVGYTSYIFCLRNGLKI